MSLDEIYASQLIFPDYVYEDNENEKTIIKDYSSNTNKNKDDSDRTKKIQEEEDQLAKYSLSYLLKKAEESIKREELLDKQQK